MGRTTKKKRFWLHAPRSSFYRNKWASAMRAVSSSNRSMGRVHFPLAPVSSHHYNTKTAVDRDGLVDHKGSVG